ncbi:hypothetical protein BT69DRAFT_1329316 [Atractiella rhizophila]|nr:hypothetical protein BT69DRAFT_1329316 [Atractiella rhizophila]
MRTYDVNAVHSADRCTVLEAARATSSAPQFFPPSVIDKVKYVAIGNNNPAAIAMDESKRIWGEGSQIACVVSLGSGIAPVVKWSGAKREIESKGDCRGLFPVQAMGDIKWEEWERTQDIVGRTKPYMDVMRHEAHNAAEYLVQCCAYRIAIRRRLPLPPPGSCFGREDEIQLARNAILNGRHVAIVGGAGNGKSTVALNTVHSDEIEQYFTDLTGGSREGLRFWVRCDSFDTFAQLSDHICDDVFVLPRSGEPSLDVAVHYFRSRKCLLILDNFETLLHADNNGKEHFFRTLLSNNSVSSVLVIIHRGNQVEPLDVKADERVIFFRVLFSGLPQEGALELFKNLYPREENFSLSLIKQLVEELVFHALSIKLFALHANEDLTMTLKQLLHKWKDRKTDVFWDEEGKSTMMLRRSISFSLNSPELERQGERRFFGLALLSWVPDGVSHSDLLPLISTTYVHQGVFKVITVISKIGLADYLQDQGTLCMLAPIRQYINRLVRDSSPPFSMTLAVSLQPLTNHLMQKPEKIAEEFNINGDDRALRNSPRLFFGGQYQNLEHVLLESMVYHQTVCQLSAMWRKCQKPRTSISGSQSFSYKGTLYCGRSDRTRSEALRSVKAEVFTDCVSRLPISQGWCH